MLDLDLLGFSHQKKKTTPETSKGVVTNQELVHGSHDTNQSFVIFGKSPPKIAMCIVWFPQNVDNLMSGSIFVSFFLVDAIFSSAELAKNSCCFMSNFPVKNSTQDTHEISQDIVEQLRSFPAILLRYSNFTEFFPQKHPEFEP